MNRLVPLVAMLLLASCGDRAASRAEPDRAASNVAVAAEHPAAAASAAEMLVASAAEDFRAHGPVYPDRVRAVRLGSVPAAGGGTQYMICGEFLASGPGGSAEWSPFATIRTDPYEQWLGVQAAGLCAQPSLTWETPAEVLTLRLQTRLDSLRP